MKNILNTIKQNDNLDNLTAISLLLAFSLTFVMLFKVISIANVGFDLTDEGYYFNWISNPWLYKYYTSQFGYIYHPIYKALGYSIVHLRQANIIISYALTWLLNYYVLKLTFENSSKTVLIISSASLALPALFILMIMGQWLPSPSYNSLNFQGCLIVALGFVFAINQNTKQQIIAGILIGMGGWLIFMAKPSTAFLLAVVSVIYFLPTIKKDWRILLGAGLVAIALLLLTAFAIDGSVLQFIKRYQGGLLLIKTMHSIHGLDNLLKLDLFKISVIFKLKLAVLIVLLFLSFKLVNSKREFLRATIQVILFFTMIVAFYLFLNPPEHKIEIENYHVLIITALTFASLLYFLFSQRTKSIISNKLILLFLILPYLFAAGTGNNYWKTAAGASEFWVLAAVLLLARATFNLQLMSVAVCFVINVSVFGLFDAMRIPYRQTEVILKQTATYLDPHANQKLILSSDTAKYLNTLNKAFYEAQFKSNTPVIDLTGHHPGTLYFMQAKAIGLAWTSGGYSGSYNHAALALHQATCEEIASAWLLIEKDGRRQLPITIMNEHGIQVNETNYIQMSKFFSQKLFKSNKSKGVFQQYLVKPLNIKNQTETCLKYRELNPSPFE